MGINWINARGTTRGSADVEINLVRCRKDASYPQIAIRITKGAVAAKLSHAERLCVGMDDHFSRLYFKPTAVMDKSGYKLTAMRGEKCVTQMTVSKWAAAFPSVAPSKLVGTYDLKKDEESGLYYVSIGALPR